MGMWRAAKTAVFIALATYFAFRVAYALQKLYGKRLSTSSTTRQSRNISFPAMTFCPVILNSESKATNAEQVLAVLNETDSEILLHVQYGLEKG